MRVLVVNVGSSSIKLSVIADGRESLASFDVEVHDSAATRAAIEEALSDSGLPDAIGHRIVHGGTRFCGPTLLEDSVMAELEELSSLAPLHQKRGLEGVALVRRLLPSIPTVGCFDTAFFSDLPERSCTYAIPKEWTEGFGIKRFGFHGLSHSYVGGRAAEMLGEESARRVVTCHLGSGASLAALRQGKPVDTTMGFTPLEGLVMSTRSGTVDPGLLIWLLAEGRLDLERLADGLENRSGLLGLAGSADMRAVMARAAAGERDASLALDVYIHRLRAGIAAMATAMDGVDVLAFAGGVGENSAEVRAIACSGLSHLGVRINERRNARGRPDARIDDETSNVAVLVLTSREDLQIAQEVERLLGSPTGSPG